jgi:hypothetical protein
MSLDSASGFVLDHFFLALDHSSQFAAFFKFSLVFIKSPILEFDGK